MGFIVASGGEFARTFEGNYLATSDTTFLVLTAPTPSASKNVVYSSSIGKTGTTPWTFTLIDGALPTGLSLNGTTGDITGTPTVLGVFTFTVEVEDSLGAQQIEEFTITITSAEVPGSGVYKIIPSQRFDQLYSDLTDPNNPVTANVVIPNIFAETALLGDDNEENVNHIAGVKYRITGFGLLKSTLKGLDDVTTDILADLTMSATPGYQPTQLANFVGQRVRLRMEVSSTTYYYYFNINRIVFYAKPIWSEFPR